MTIEQSPLPPINIVVPVYGDFAATRRALESLLASDLPADTRITIVNDASPEPELSDWCGELAQAGRVTLLVNPENRGFVHSVNRGIRAEPGADILLLNSDTEVAGDWVQRMQRCAYSASDIGTVTPFSNNATICSFPVFLESNPLPTDWNTADLDALFKQVNEGASEDLPTAVGFCMFIRRQCLDEVGLFDEEQFGEGYGEECDFSMRAAAKGWRNVLAADVFVFHAGAASFADSSQSRKQEADEIISQLHPAYNERVNDYIHKDPASKLRDAANQQRLIQRPGDAGDVIAEASLYASKLRQRSEANYQGILAEREVRERFEAKLGTALEKAVWQEDQLKAKQAEMEAMAKQLHDENVLLLSLLEDTRGELRKTDTALGETQQQLRDVIDEITLMKLSRSWRYTAWLRRLTGKS